MNASFYKKFYKNLGKLLYAIAKADGKIQEPEVKAIHDLVTTDLAPIEESTDNFGTDAAFFAEFEFEILRDQEANKDRAYQKFLEFLKENDKHIGLPLRNLILSSVEKVAEAYHGTEEAEAKLIADLKGHLFKK
jgi:uncharacterized tellurite resistance protein B-like protein